MSSPRWSSGSSMIHHPPGPPRPFPKGPTSSSPRYELANACGIAGRGIVDRAARRGHVEQMSDVAQPMAMRVMLRMLDIPADEERRTRQGGAAPPRGK